MAGLRSTKILAALSARLAAQGLAGHLIQFEAGFAPSSSPCIFAAAKHRFRFFDKQKHSKIIKFLKLHAFPLPVFVVCFTRMKFYACSPSAAA